MIAGMTLGQLKARITEAQRLLGDDALVVMYIPMTDGVITPLSHVDAHDFYVGKERASTGTLFSWDDDECPAADVGYEEWRAHMVTDHSGIPCFTVYGMR